MTTQVPMMPDAAHDADILLHAAQLNVEDELLVGSTLHFPDYGQAVMTGDLHGHRRNFDKLKRYCDLEHTPPRHVILHEIIHEPVETLEGRDRSFEVLIQAAQWKVDFPEQVHLLQSNHELSQYHRHEIAKNGRAVTQEFEMSLAETYGPGADRVIEAVRAFIRSLPLAGRTPNRVFLSHSLPGPRELDRFDPAVLTRRPTEEDLSEFGSAHKLVWGRHQTSDSIEQLRELLGVDYFIAGHEPQEDGYAVMHERLIILASDHNHGVFLPIDLNKPANITSLTRSIRPFAGVA